MKMLVMESSMVKNCRLNHHGFNPAQWVLGRLPADATSLTAEEAEGRNLGVQEEIQSGEDAFSQQLMIRQAAKQAYAKVDSSRRVRAALLRKAVPLRGPYSPGDLVSPPWPMVWSWKDHWKRRKVNTLGYPWRHPYRGG